MHLTYILHSYHSAFHCRDPNQLTALTQTCMPTDCCWNQSKHIGNSPLNSIIIARGHWCLPQHLFPHLCKNISCLSFFPTSNMSFLMPSFFFPHWERKTVKKELHMYLLPNKPILSALVPTAFCPCTTDKLCTPVSVSSLCVKPTSPILVNNVSEKACFFRLLYPFPYHH